MAEFVHPEDVAVVGDLAELVHPEDGAAVGDLAELVHPEDGAVVGDNMVQAACVWRLTGRETKGLEKPLQRNLSTQKTSQRWETLRSKRHVFGDSRLVTNDRASPVVC